MTYYLLPRSHYSNKQSPHHQERVSAAILTTIWPHWHSYTSHHSSQDPNPEGMDTTQWVGQATGDRTSQRVVRDSRRSYSTSPGLSTSTILIQHTCTYMPSQMSASRHMVLLFTFVIAKSWVAPLKSPTLPRLELTAALTAAQLVKFVIDSWHWLTALSMCG